MYIYILMYVYMYILPYMLIVRDRHIDLYVLCVLIIYVI